MSNYPQSLTLARLLANVELRLVSTSMDLLNLHYQSSSSGTNLLGSNTVLMYLFVSGLDQIHQTTGLGPRLRLRANWMIEPDSHCAIDTCRLQYGHLWSIPLSMVPLGLCHIKYYLLNGEQPRGCLDATTRVHKGIPLKAHLGVEGIGILGIIR